MPHKESGRPNNGKFQKFKGKSSSRSSFPTKKPSSNLLMLHHVLESDDARKLNTCCYVTDGDAAVSSAQVPQSSEAHVNAKSFENLDVHVYAAVSQDVFAPNQVFDPLEVSAIDTMHDALDAS